MSQSEVQNSISQSSFSYEGRNYNLVVTLTSYDEEDKISNTVILKNSDINQIDILLGVEELYTKGYIEYFDATGDLNQLEGDIRCNISMSELHDEKNGEVSTVKPIAEHNFFQDFTCNMEKSGETTIDKGICYTLYLQGIDALNLARNVRSVQSSEEEYPSELIKKMLTTDAELKINEESFNTTASNKKIKYTLCANDTVYSAINYCLNAMYFNIDSGDEGAIKFLAYDHIKKEYGFRQFSFPVKDGSYLKGEVLALSFNSHGINKLTNEIPVVLASVPSMPRAEMAMNLSTIEHVGYDIKGNDFTFSEIKPQKIMNCVSGSSTNSKMDDQKKNTKGMKRTLTEWNNSLSIYKQLMDIAVNYQNIVVNTSALLGRRLFDYIGVTVDRRITQASLDDKKETNTVMKKYSNLIGVWAITQLHFIIKQGDNPSFTQCIRLSRVNTTNGK